MELKAKPLFKRNYKKFSEKNRRIIDSEITKIMEDPINAGEQKKGDLKGIYVHYFKMDDQNYLLAYTFDPVTLTLICLGLHENYYRNLKKYIN